MLVSIKSMNYFTWYLKIFIKKGASAPVIDIYINDITKDINIDTNTIFDVTIIALDKAFINSSNKYIFYQLLYLNYYLSRRFYSGSINIKGINTL